MNTIWKYQLAIGKINKIEMPVNAQVLTVQAQMNEPMLWDLVDTDEKLQIRHFEIAGTGHQLPKLEDDRYRKYINTFQIDEGVYVFHLFEHKLITPLPLLQQTTPLNNLNP